MESIKAHLLTLFDEVTQTLEITKKVRTNNKKEYNKLMRMYESNGDYVDTEKLVNDIEVLCDKIAEEEKEIYAMKKIAYRINKAIQFANGEVEE